MPAFVTTFLLSPEAHCDNFPIQIDEGMDSGGGLREEYEEERKEQEDLDWD